MFYASKHGSRAHSATEGEERGVVTADSVICRYDYFVNSRTIIPPAELERCRAELERCRAKLQEQHQQRTRARAQRPRACTWRKR